MGPLAKKRRARKGPSPKLPSLIEVLLKGRYMTPRDIVTKLEGLGHLDVDKHRNNRAAVITTLRRSWRFRKLKPGVYGLSGAVKKFED